MNNEILKSEKDYFLRLAIFALFWGIIWLPDYLLTPDEMVYAGDETGIYVLAVTVGYVILMSVWTFSLACRREDKLLGLLSNRVRHLIFWSLLFLCTYLSFFTEYRFDSPWADILMRIADVVIFYAAVLLWSMAGLIFWRRYEKSRFYIITRRGGRHALQLIKLILALPRERPKVARTVMSVILILALGFAVYYLDRRLATIELALGGREGLECYRADKIEKSKSSVVRIVGGLGDGSGFYIGKDIIVTSYHVIADEPSPKIVYSDNKFEEGRVFAAEPNTDIALIRVAREGDALKWFEGEVKKGDKVHAIGYALGGQLEGEVTENVTSVAGIRYYKEDAQPALIQVNGGLASGMSGGPLLDPCGRVVGINFSSEENIDFAVDYRNARELVDDMRNNIGGYNYDIARIEYEPDKSPTDTVRAYYNYLKTRNFFEAFDLLSENFIGDVAFQDWREGFAFSLDTSILSIKADPNNPMRVFVSIGSTDLIEGSFVYRVFEGSWIVRKINGHYRLWESNMRETTDEF